MCSCSEAAARADAPYSTSWGRLAMIWTGGGMPEAYSTQILGPIGERARSQKNVLCAV